MRFMIVHKNDPQTEAGRPPPMELVTNMGAFIGEYAKSGRLIDGAGLGASATRTRLVFRNGRSVVKRGPYAGEHELSSLCQCRRSLDPKTTKKKASTPIAFRWMS